jgi:hypothetical protein
VCHAVCAADLFVKIARRDRRSLTMADDDARATAVADNGLPASAGAHVLPNRLVLLIQGIALGGQTLGRNGQISVSTNTV